MIIRARHRHRGRRQSQEAASVAPVLIDSVGPGYCVPLDSAKPRPLPLLANLSDHIQLTESMTASAVNCWSWPAYPCLASGAPDDINHPALTQPSTCVSRPVQLLNTIPVQTIFWPTRSGSTRLHSRNYLRSFPTSNWRPICYFT